MATKKCGVIYDDHDEEEMGDAEYKNYKMKVKDQVVVKLANVPGARFWKVTNDCKSANGHCYHLWSKDTSGFNPKKGGRAFTAYFRMQGWTQQNTPSNFALPDVDFYAAISFLHLTPNAIDLSDEIQEMMNHVAMMSKSAKVNAKSSAYDPDSMSLDACKKPDNWENPKQGNLWKQAIMKEIENLKNFDVFTIISLSSVRERPSGTNVFLIVTE